MFWHLIIIFDNILGNIDDSNIMMQYIAGIFWRNTMCKYYDVISGMYIMTKYIECILRRNTSYTYHDAIHCIRSMMQYIARIIMTKYILCISLRITSNTIAHVICCNMLQWRVSRTISNAYYDATQRMTQ